MSISIRTAISGFLNRKKAGNQHQHISCKMLAVNSIDFPWCITNSDQKSRQGIYDSSFNKSSDQPLLSRPPGIWCSTVSFPAFSALGMPSNCIESQKLGLEKSTDYGIEINEVRKATTQPGKSAHGKRSLEKESLRSGAKQSSSLLTSSMICRWRLL